MAVVHKVTITPPERVVGEPPTTERRKPQSHFIRGHLWFKSVSSVVNSTPGFTTDDTD
jgi:hypothetical protein